MDTARENDIDYEGIDQYKSYSLAPRERGEGTNLVVKFKFYDALN